MAGFDHSAQFLQLLNHVLPQCGIPFGEAGLQPDLDMLENPDQLLELLRPVQEHLRIVIPPQRLQTLPQQVIGLPEVRLPHQGFPQAPGSFSDVAPVMDVEPPSQPDQRIGVGFSR